MAGSWATSAFRWLELDIASLRWSRWIARAWPDLRFGYSFSLNFVDDVVWSVIGAVESVALVSMIVFFFVFCGCNV